ncbi:MAG TPA: hypothetical protein H9830_15045 [Candidatus Agrococcus pullicola]|uniref:Uncharacterized protein n=1 Tax=Candidatus Agrococcus pullicola TaxID=2838429 RepID=A0A9D2CB48_9MICO|nr:hypothetical protein [Candidatus Agrococcus pullicola]
MARVADPAELARILPGVWNIRASSGGYWKNGTREDPRVRIEITQKSPLQLREFYEYYRRDKGDREFEAVAEWKGSHFSWRMDEHPEAQSAFVVSDTPATPDVIALHISNSAETESSVTIFARPRLAVEEVRALISRDTYSFELTADEFWQLSWLSGSNDS